MRRCGIGEWIGLELSVDGELKMEDGDVERFGLMPEYAVRMSNEGMGMGYIDGIGG